MKKILFGLLFTWIAICSVLAQDVKLVYFDANNKFLSTTKKAKTFRTATKQADGKWKIVDKTKDGVLIQEGLASETSIEQYFIIHPDFFNYPAYFGINTNDQLPTLYSEWTAYFKSGTKKYQAFFDNSGQRTGTWIGWFANGKIDYEVQFLNSLQHGLSKWYSDKGELVCTEEYDNGRPLVLKKLINGIMVEQSKFEVFSPPSHEYQLSKYIQKNIPKAGVQKNLSGVVRFIFTIDEKGGISNTTVTQSLEESFDNLLTFTINGMVDWKPAMMHNRNIAINYDYETTFWIEPEAEEAEETTVVRPKPYNKSNYLIILK